MPQRRVNRPWVALFTTLTFTMLATWRAITVDVRVQRGLETTRSNAAWHWSMLVVAGTPPSKATTRVLDDFSEQALRSHGQWQRLPVADKPQADSVWMAEALNPFGDERLHMPRTVVESESLRVGRMRATRALSAAKQRIARRERRLAYPALAVALMATLALVIWLKSDGRESKGAHGRRAGPAFLAQGGSDET